jgi:hypothetical protein
MLWIILRKIFFLKKSLYSPSGMVWSKMTIFSITQPFLDGSFSSSNSTEILMRQFCAQNFSSIECNCEELSCKRTDGRTDTLTDSRVYSLFEYTKMSLFTNALGRYLFNASFLEKMCYFRNKLRSLPLTNRS